MMFGKPTRRVSDVFTRTAPIKGLNAFDSIASMPEGFALVLRNFYAQPYGCQGRKGYRRHVGELLGPVESLCSHNRTGDAKLYAFVFDISGSTMLDVTTMGGPPVTKLTGLGNARWQHLNFANAAGVHMVAVNGANPMIWVKPDNSIVQVVSGSGTGDTIGGVNPANLIHVYSHQKRLWFVEKNSSRAWYLPPDQITGVAKSFDFGPLWTMGGELSQLITWTIDDGDGADDHLVAISTMGQVSVYTGTDPEGADTWALQGVYYASSPIGRRAATRYGGDIMILTHHGIVFLSDLLKSTKVNPTEDNVAKYIQNLVTASVNMTGHRFGWQPFIFPGGNMVMVNIPATLNTSYQFVMNHITKAWSEFLGYNAYCWELHNDLPFFGGFGAVHRAWEGTTDDSVIDPETGVITEGADINCEAQTTFTYFGSLGTQKHFKMVRPTILSRGGFKINFSVNTDFIFDSPLTPASFATQNPGVWDVDLWDAAAWEGGLLTYKNWQSITGIGTAGSIRLLLKLNQETYWATTDWLYEVGGVM